jgi:hypothetical protein
VPDDCKGAESRDLICEEARPQSLITFFCIFRKWVFSYLGKVWRSAGCPLSKQEVKLETWSGVRTGTSFSSRQTAKAPREAHSEKKKMKEAMRK